jgi:hypothetical protein
MNIVRIGAQTIAAKWLDHNLPGFERFQYFFIGKNHVSNKLWSYTFTEAPQKYFEKPVFLGHVTFWAHKQFI